MAGNLNKKDFLLVVGGPTASGKSSLSVEIAKKLLEMGHCPEIVSADSMQIYKELSIGTARPSHEEMGEIPHHMLGILSVSESFSVAKYVERAREVIKEIWNRGGLPILCGGTGLYINSILDNIQFSEEISNEEVRKELYKQIENEGLESLCEELQKIDPVAYERVDLNNPARVIRAVEIYRTSGFTMTQQIERSRQTPPQFESLMIFLDFKDRELLYDRINRRVDIMLEMGLLDEVKGVIDLGDDTTAAQAIGYKELIPYLKQKEIASEDGDIFGECSLGVCVENLKRNTRRYAKRQLTWFRKREDKNTFFVDDYSKNEELLQAVMKRIEEAI